MNKKLLVGLAAVLAFGTAGAVAYADAPGRGGRGVGMGGVGYQEMLQTKASLVGLSVDALKQELQTKTFLQVANEHGVTQVEIQAAMQTAARERLEKLVSAGMITAAERDERLERMADRQETCPNGGGMRGFRQGVGR